ncbi:cupin domain-containing protein [Holdemanella porci]|uniref:cupin domain-containing protein n=1 Tax=Holdemanella porci TaxID=2652276 RepID=UPI003AB5605C
MEVIQTSNYKKTNVGNEGRTELHEALSLTGAEVSINSLPAGASVPFVHSHKNNEEIYGVITGKGTVIIDGDTVEITAGDWLKISPAVKRQIFAANDSGITYICIQVKENSLDGFTVNDAIIY